MPDDAPLRERLQPSLLDRLTDDERDRSREAPDRQFLSNQALRQAVLRDLAWLLNTTDLATTTDLSEHPRAAASTINFGVPAITGNVATAARLTALQGRIAEAVRRFEPRIRAETLKVIARPGDAARSGTTLVLDITGELWAQPVPQPVFLQTAIDLDQNTIVIAEKRAR